MKKILVVVNFLLLSACSPVDSTRELDQQQTRALVRNMYPVETNARAMAPVTLAK